MIIASEEEIDISQTKINSSGCRQQTLKKLLYCITENVPNTHSYEYTELLQITQKGILISPKKMLQAIVKFQ